MSWEVNSDNSRIGLDIYYDARSQAHGDSIGRQNDAELYRMRHSDTGTRSSGNELKKNCHFQIRSLYLKLTVIEILS